MKLGDKLKCSDLEYVGLTLDKMAIHFRNTAQWISTNFKPSKESRVLENLIWGMGNYLKLAAENLDNHISVLGLAVRGLYELRLRAELLVSDPAEFDNWQAEAGSDKIQLLEGILGISTEGGGAAQRKILEEEIQRIRTLLNKHGLKEARPAATADIAKKLGEEEEHKSLFKLLSKIVHPTSYLINNYKDAASDEISQILQIHAQLYAWDAFERCCDHLNLPKEVREFSLPPTGPPGK